MPATMTERADDRVKVEVSIELSRSMLNTEEAIQTALNEAGRQLSGEALKYFDSDGSPMVIGGEVWRTKGAQRESVSDAVWRGEY